MSTSIRQELGPRLQSVGAGSVAIAALLIVCMTGCSETRHAPDEESAGAPTGPVVATEGGDLTAGRGSGGEPAFAEPIVGGERTGRAHESGGEVTDSKGAPVFRGEEGPIPKEILEHMIGRSWREGCPVEPSELSLLTVSHWDMQGRVAGGELVVASEVSTQVLRAFELLFERRFPIEKMRRIAQYQGDDDLSMADNNTSAFNCRRVAGTTRWSEHSYGTAIDINPIQNPYVRGDLVAPEAGSEYLDRSKLRPGMVEGFAVAAFEEIGWQWGGRWQSAKDYQHFSSSGR